MTNPFKLAVSASASDRRLWLCNCCWNSGAGYSRAVVWSEQLKMCVLWTLGLGWRTSSTQDSAHKWSPSTALGVQAHGGAVSVGQCLSAPWQCDPPHSLLGHQGKKQALRGRFWTNSVRPASIHVVKKAKLLYRSVCKDLLLERVVGICRECEYVAS